MKRSLFLSILSTVIITLTAQTWRSSLYPTNWTPGYTYTQGRFLHDFSYAGYKSGMESLPIVTNNVVDISKAPYYADKTGIIDVTTKIQQAVTDVENAGGGVVYLPQGIYKVSVASNQTVGVRIQKNNVIIRGDGTNKTYIKNVSTYMRDNFLFYFFPTDYAGWQNSITNTGAQITQNLLTPTTIIPLSTVSGYSIGNEVLLGSECTADFVEEHYCTNIWASLADVAAGRATSALRGPRFCRTIKSINSTAKTIEIDVPIRYFLKTRDNARLWKAGPSLQECGIENLSIGNVENPKTTGWGDNDYDTSGTGAYDVAGSYIIVFKNVKNCWAKNVATYRPVENAQDIHILSNGISIRDSRLVTISQCNFQKSQYEGGDGNGYMYTLEGNDCLLDRCHAQDGRHNYDFKQMSSNGNVLYNCTSKDPRYSSDYHMYLSMSNLIDGFVSDGDNLEASFRPYGQYGSPPLNFHGYSATQSVYWNTKGNYCHSVGYLISSQQFGWGYIIGTTGDCYNVKTTPVSGVASYGGYNLDYNSAPEDFVEGVGLGSLLSPQSLYQDMLQKRKNSIISSASNSIQMNDIEIVQPERNTIIFRNSDKFNYEEIKVISTDGKIVYQKNGNDQDDEIKVAGLQPGFYIIRVIAKTGNKSKKFIVH